MLVLKHCIKIFFISTPWAKYLDLVNRVPCAAALELDSWAKRKFGAQLSEITLIGILFWFDCHSCQQPSQRFGMRGHRKNRQWRTLAVLKLIEELRQGVPQENLSPSSLPKLRSSAFRRFSSGVTGPFRAEC
jgi:hypothetical protein